MGPRRRSRRGQETSADLRPARQFISNALAAGVSIFEIARIAGTSVRMIEKHYGAVLDGAQGPGLQSVWTLSTTRRIGRRPPRERKMSDEDMRHGSDRR